MWHISSHTFCIDVPETAVFSPTMFEKCIIKSRTTILPLCHKYNSKGKFHTVKPHGNILRIKCKNYNINVIIKAFVSSLIKDSRSRKSPIKQSLGDPSSISLFCLFEWKQCRCIGCHFPDTVCSSESDGTAGEQSKHRKWSWWMGAGWTLPGCQSENRDGGRWILSTHCRMSSSCLFFILM